MRLGQNIGSVYSEGKEIQRVYSRGKLVWEKEPIDYNITPFTIKAVDDNVNVFISMNKNSGSVKYTFNGVDWIIMDTPTDIHLNANDSISIITTNIRRIFIEGLSDVYGNIMSLEYGDDFIGQTVWVGSNVHPSYGLFYNTDIRSAKNLILPATTLSEGAYKSMFGDCSSLTVAPELPATTLSPYCYREMFSGCNSLTKAPSLPATTLTQGCYMDMFVDCSSLTKAPELPATTLSPACYLSMFAGCVNLTVAPELPATTMTESCYDSMFVDCSSLTKAPSLPATTLAKGCYRGMFGFCSNLTTAPSLPATTLAGGCYARMFYVCSSLTKAPELPATTLVSACYNSMFAHCSKLNYIKCYATSVESNINIGDVFGTIAYPDEVWENWTTGVASKGVFACKKKISTTLEQFIPSTWSVEYFT